MTVHGRELGNRLCKALGLEPTEITSISVHASVNGMASVWITKRVDDPTADALAGAMVRYELVES